MFDFREWYQEWLLAPSEGPARLYENMLDAFTKGREIEKEEQQRKIEFLETLLKDALPYIDDMVGIASGARSTKSDIENYFQLGTPCPHGYFDWDLCPDCCH